jgi:hypothetical protein
MINDTFCRPFPHSMISYLWDIVSQHKTEYVSLDLIHARRAYAKQSEREIYTEQNVAQCHKGIALSLL